MTTCKEIGDRIRLYFVDTTSTEIIVLDDETIQDRIVQECELHGWDLRDVIDYSIEGPVHADEYGIDNA